MEPKAACYLSLFSARWIHSISSKSTSLTTIFILSTQLCLVFQTVIDFWFLHQSSVRISLLSTYATCPAHLVLFDLLGQMIFGQQYSSWSSSWYNFLPPPVSHSLSGSYHISYHIIYTAPYDMNTQNLITQIYSLYIFTVLFSSSYYHPNKQYSHLQSDTVRFGI